MLSLLLLRLLHQTPLVCHHLFMSSLRLITEADHRGRSQTNFRQPTTPRTEASPFFSTPPPVPGPGNFSRPSAISWSMGKHRLQLLAAVIVLACGAAPSTPSALPRSCFVPPQRAGGGGAGWRNCRHGEEAGGSGSMAANRGERDARGMRCRVLQLRGGGSDSDKGETCYGRWVNVSQNGKRKREK